MNNEIFLLSVSAATVGFIHTLFGPDHYVPFIVMSKARNWSLWKTSLLTVLCGLGHVGSSIVLGIIGIAMGIGVSKLTSVEGIRGNLAAWAFILFGFGYFIWGIWKAYKNRPHKHIHSHGELIHGHEHHHAEATHIIDHHNHNHKKKKPNITPWILFTIFVLGPCEPLIPLFIYPAAQHNTSGVLIVSLVFSLVTVITMLAMVLLLSAGLKAMPFGKLERYTHAIAGATIFLSGCAIVFLGL
ncbi:MAG: sulfite exporter TauE/SafE family protein [Bacteroidales bacterium]|nr:sulfite exporter TauE/SafE family protein [Bacteroidales bacterium]